LALCTPEPEKKRLRSLLLEMAAEANEKAEHCWRKRKGPMAAYWRAVSTYAKHTAKAFRSNISIPPVVKDSLTTETTLAEETGCCTFEPSSQPIDREVMRIGKTLFRELSEKAALLDKLVKAPLPAGGDDTAKYHLDWFLESAGWYRYTDPDDMQIKLAKRCKEVVRESK
jgi:hypothetical protein